ncbi:Oxysterol binding protein [Tritrichomonas foetus]|uniref:Oxysterol binding protein n=1 Tax=Tritrichomonas foetus TaxID=1144522 RepID=A0A1J4L4B2_9EUKA|nr:Oxysterol binding protein [Tritrichomonas foetus]|eukprot:OHT16765.1 Oxysterol binding protein [Tritrichomonas foetus]
MTLTSRAAAPTTVNELAVLATADGVDLRTTSIHTDIPRTEISHGDDNDYSHERERALTKMTADGLKPMTAEECEEERKTTKALLKKFTTGLLKLDSNALSFPIMYSEPRSYLERCADIFSFLVEKYIDMSINLTNLNETANSSENQNNEDKPAQAEAGNKASPENINYQKLAYIAAGIIASFHIDIGPKKVFNPYLGETYYGKWENGTEIYGEQSSHHPPISDIILFGPERRWKCFAHMDFDIDSGLNNVELKQNGTFRLEIKDGNIYEWKFPVTALTGFVKGERIVKVKGTLEVIDVTNNLICSIDISPRKDSKKGLTNPVASTIYGGMKPNEPKLKKFNHIITGDYCNQVLLDGNVIWDIHNDIVHRPVTGVPEEMLLPSDVRFRFDRVLLIQGKLEEADKAKTALEELQRREEKLRECVPSKKLIEGMKNLKIKFGKK